MKHILFALALVGCGSADGLAFDTATVDGGASSGGAPSAPTVFASGGTPGTGGTTLTVDAGADAGVTRDATPESAGGASAGGASAGGASAGGASSGGTPSAGGASSGGAPPAMFCIATACPGAYGTDTACPNPCPAACLGQAWCLANGFHATTVHTGCSADWAQVIYCQ